MYAALASAGASQLYSLYKSVTGSSSSGTPFDPSSIDDTSSGSTGPVNSTSSSGSNFSSALQKLFTDLQASTSSSTSASASDPTSTIANDLQTVSQDAKTAGPHGHHHHHGGTPPGSFPGDDSQSASTDGSSSPTTASTSGTTNPFQGLASSLLAYAKTQSQSLTASTSTSLTA